MKIGILGSGLMGGKLSTSWRAPVTTSCSATPQPSQAKTACREAPGAAQAGPRRRGTSLTSFSSPCTGPMSTMSCVGRRSLEVVISCSMPMNRATP